MEPLAFRSPCLRGYPKSSKRKGMQAPWIHVCFGNNPVCARSHRHSREPRQGRKRQANIFRILYPKYCILYPECMPYWFDGNNLIGLSAAAAKSDRQTRRAFLYTLSSYHKSGGGKFLVYFDGDDPSGASAPPGVAVRYSAPESTDAAILRHLKEIQHPSEVIVVTNDRELMARCRNAGATALDWRQFNSKMQSRPILQSRKKNDMQERVDVDDWLHYFGLDKTNK
jgi:predicted RNA-binding protein with PIN domain